jgi:hypothetical protein
LFFAAFLILNRIARGAVSVSHNSNSLLHCSVERREAQLGPERWS